MFARRFFCMAPLLIAIAGCTDGASNLKDPPIRTVDARGNTSSDKRAPDQFWVKLETTKGDVIIEVNRAWSPYGADRFYELVSDRFYDGCRFFRVLDGFVAQVGINGDPATNDKWKRKSIPDDHFAQGDKALQSNKRGYVSFAKAGPDTRTTQIFVNCVNNSRLDAMGFTPFGQVIDGMAVIDSLYSGYREEPMGSTDRIEAEGNAYLDAAFPKLDAIKTATLLSTKPKLPTKPAE